MTYLFDESREKRRLVRYDELPEHLIKAVLAVIKQAVGEV